MNKRHESWGRAARCSGLVAALGVSQLLFGSGAEAASATGSAAAKVSGEIVSQPVAIGLQTSVTSGQSSGSGSVPGVTSGQPADAARSAGTSFGVALIEVDPDGVARFNVAGADTTSGYVVRLPSAVDDLLDQFPSASGGCSSDDQKSCDRRATAAALIVPARALSDGRLTIEINRVLADLFSGKLSVQVNYN